MTLSWITIILVNLLEHALDTKLESIYLRHVIELMDYSASKSGPDELLESFATMKGMPKELKEHLITLATERNKYWEEVESNIREKLASNHVPMHYSLHIRDDRTFCVFDDFGTIIANSSTKTIDASDLEVLNNLVEFIKSKIPTKTGDIIDISITSS